MRVPMFAADYPYLISSLIMLLAFIVGAILSPMQRRAMLVSGLLSAPYAFASILFVPEYWQPKRIASFLVGPEDIIFSFAGGGLVWLIATLVTCPQTTVSLQVGRVMRRYIWWTASFFFLVVAFKYLFSLNTMTSVFVSGTLNYVLLLCIRSDLLRFSMAAGLCYCVIYTLTCVLVFALWPDFLNQWNWDNLIGVTLIGVPIEESIWAFVFAACWTLAGGYTLEACLSEKAVAT